MNQQPIYRGQVFATNLPPPQVLRNQPGRGEVASAQKSGSLYDFKSSCDDGGRP